MKWFLFLAFFLQQTSAWAQVAGDITVYTNRVDLYRAGSFSGWVKEFEKLYPRAKVKIVAIDDYEKAVNLDDRRYGDVVLVPRDIPRSTYPNYFLPLNDMGVSDYFYFSDNWAEGGKEYAYSQGVSPEGLVYNKAVFRALDIAGPPSTLDELFAVAEKLKAAGKTAIALNVGAGWPLQQWDKAVMVFAEDGRYYDTMVGMEKPFANGKPYRQSLNVAYQIFIRGYSESDFVLNLWEQSKQDFANGKVAMFYLGSWVIPQLINEGISSEDIGFVPFPLDNLERRKGILNYDWGMAVSKYSKNPQTAKAWLNFILTKSDFADASGFMSTDKRRKSSTPQLAQYMSNTLEMIQAEPHGSEFTRLANKAGMDFMAGKYIRDILISPDFDGSMDYWNRRWSEAGTGFRTQ